jgi:exodeoxyribonuclease V gamma subunit
VIVMCPDIETFAPLVQATFGAGDSLDGQEAFPSGVPRLMVRLADRAVRQTNPTLGALAELLELATARITASELVDFASLEPVRRRFHFDDDALARLEEWVSATGIRWGLDAAHRAPFHLHAVNANTWQAGLDRLLLGVAMSEDDRLLVGGVLPLDDVDSGDIALAGRLAEFVERVRTAITTLTARRPMAGWVNAIAAAADALFVTGPHDEWQRTELDGLLAEILDQSSGAPAAEISLPELRALLADRLRGKPSRVNFRTGHLTVCTLVPMRSVPHRVVCLLGLDDGAFPRHGAPDGDDIIERAPAVGDRDVRSEDRQLLLDALLAAGDHVVLTYCGRDERTNAVRPPSVPVGELLDVIDATARTATAATGTAREHVVVEHPLQAFDARNFEPGRMVPRTPWSFDLTARDGARAIVTERAARPRFLDGPLPPLDSVLVELDDLVQFVQHPVKAFLRQRLGVSVGDTDDELDNTLPIELDALEKWSVGDRLLAARLAGVDWEIALAAERARGLLPPGVLGAAVLDEIRPVVDAIHAAVVARADLGIEARSVDVEVDVGPAGLGAGRVTGTVTGIRGATLVSATYSRLAAKHRIAAWVRLLAATAGGAADVTALCVGKGRRGAGVSVIPPVGPDQAVRHLAALVDLYRRGMREPLPIYCNTSEALARRANAKQEWISGQFPNEDKDAAHVFVLGQGVEFMQLLAEPPRPDECGEGWAINESSRTAVYARRLWDGLLAVEQREDGQ